MWHIYTMEYYAAIIHDKLVFFVETLMNLETIILSKLTQQQKNQTPHVLIHRWMLKNENTWTQGGEHQTLGSVGGCQGRNSGGVGSWGEIAWGEMPGIGEGEEGSKSHCHVRTYATILHVLHMYPKT